MKFDRLKFIAALFYPSGDFIAASITQGPSAIRFLGIFVVGFFVYGTEIPFYFGWLQKKFLYAVSLRAKLLKTAMAICYFNPLWIARHFIIIDLLQGRWNPGWHYLVDGCESFLYSTPILYWLNFLIQNQVPLKYRFFASASLSFLTAIYYGWSKVYFA